MGASIAVFLGLLIGKIVDAIISAVGKKTLVAGILIAFIYAAYATFRAAIDSLIGSVVIPTLPAWAQIGIHTLPSNIDECIAIIGAAKIARWVFDSARMVAEIRAQS